MRTSAMCRTFSSCLQGCHPLLVPCCSTFGSEVSADIALLSSCAAGPREGAPGALKAAVPDRHKHEALWGALLCRYAQFLSVPAHCR